MAKLQLIKIFFATNAYLSYAHIQLIEKFILTIVICYKIIHQKVLFLSNTQPNIPLLYHSICFKLTANKHSAHENENGYIYGE